MKREIALSDLGLTDNRTFIIAEIAQAHDGSLGIAHSYIDAVADTGVDAIKFQTHIAAAESSRQEPWRVRFSRQDSSRFEYWKRMEFTKDQWAGLVEHARSAGLYFLSSPFSCEAVELLADLGINLWKVASGEVFNPELLEMLVKRREPLLFSSGMSYLQDIKRITERCRQAQVPFGVFQCTSAYPCSPELWGLKSIDMLKQELKCPVGFSDHSGTVQAGIAATALGAQILEVHVTFHKNMFGPDTPSSLDLKDLRCLVTGVRDVEKAINVTRTREDIAAEMQDMKKLFGRSLALRADLDEGHLIQRADLTLKKPGTGIPYEQYVDVVGRRLTRDKLSIDLLSWEDFE